MSSLPGTRVLIVEDEPLIALELEQLLGELGCVIVGSTGQLAQALEMAGSLDVDIAVLDMHLGAESALPVAEALHRRRLPIVFATGDGPDGTAVPDGVLLRKPYSMADLCSAMRQALDRGK